jgi:hypothetical protein
MHDLDRMTHPTVHEVVVGDRTTPIDGDRPDAAGFVDMVNRRIADATLRRRVRHALGELFDPRRSALSASTTLCSIVVDERGAWVRMRLANGRDVALGLYDHHGRIGYALGYIEGGQWLWTSEERLQHLAPRMARGSGLSGRLLETPE